MNLLRILAVLMYLCIAGCNSNDHDTVVGNSSGALFQSQVTLDPTVPSSIGASVATITSPLSTINSLGTIQTSNQDELVLALNAQSQIVLVGLTDGAKATVLSPESTSAGLVRLIMTLPHGMTEAQLFQRVRQASSFSKLVAAVNKSFSDGVLPSVNAAVSELLLTVADEVDKAINKPAVAAVAFLPTTPSVSNDFPFKLVRNEGAIGDISIDSSRQVANSMPIVWDAVARGYTGSILPGGNLVLPAADTKSRVSSALKNYWLGAVADYFFTEKIVAPSDGGKSFSLEVLQSKKSKIYNMTTLTFDIIMEGIGTVAEVDGNLTDDCKANVVSAIISPENMAEVATSTDASAYQENMKSLKYGAIKSAITSAKNIVPTCYKALTFNPNAIEYLAKRAAARVSLVSAVALAVSKAYDYASLAERAYLIKRYWNIPEGEYKYTVCMAKTGQIANCAVKFEHDPKDLVMVAGDVITPPIKALDVQTQQTLLPSALEVESSNLLVLASEQSYAAFGEGAVTINVRDFTTDISSTIPLDVVQPVFDKKQLTMTVDTGAALKLVDEKGRNITVSGKSGLFNFSSSRPDVVEILTSGSMGLMVKADKVGSSVITAVNNITKHQSVASINVVCPSGYVAGTDGGCVQQEVCPVDQVLQPDGSCIKICPQDSYCGADFTIYGVTGDFQGGSEVSCGEDSWNSYSPFVNHTYTWCATQGWGAKITFNCEGSCRFATVYITATCSYNGVEDSRVLQYSSGFLPGSNGAYIGGAWLGFESAKIWATGGEPPPEFGSHWSVSCDYELSGDGGKLHMNGNVSGGF